MSKRGRSTLSTDENGRILDRLAGLEQVISADRVREVLQACGRVNGRACELTHEVMLWVVLAMGLLTHLPIRQVFRHARRSAAGGDDERTLARTLWDRLPDDARLLEDRGFFSYDDWKALIFRVKLLLRVKKLRSGSSVVHGLLPDPAVPASRM